MTSLTPESWTESEDWRSIVAPDQHESFLQTIAEAHGEGYSITRVMVMGGVPVVYERRESLS